MVAAAERGDVPDPAPGIQAKQRSVHNTYFTLPVLFVMTSNHFAMAYGHAYNWLILIGVSLAGALIRVYSFCNCICHCATAEGTQRYWRVVRPGTQHHRRTLYELSFVYADSSRVPGGAARHHVRQ
jgi:uncharacterized membrane protein